MRFLFFSSIFPRPYAPVRGIYCQHLCRTLAEEDEVSVISPRPWPEVLKEPRIDALRDGNGAFLIQGLPTTYPTYIYPPKMMRTAYGRFMWMSVRRCVRRHIRAWSPDCVFSFWAHPDGEVAVRAARWAGIPSVVIVGGSDVLLLTRERRRRACVTRALAGADAVIAVSQHLRRRLIEIGIEPSRVHVVHTGVDARLFQPGRRADARDKLGIPRDRPVLLYVGNLVRLKGLDVLMSALALLKQDAVPLEAYIVGAGPERKVLGTQAASLGITDRVHFVGSVPQEQLPDWFRAADMSVLPSRSEGIPNVLRESLACGTPFVATRVGGIPEISTSPDNRLVEPDDVPGLAAAIRKTISESSPERCVQERAPRWHDTACDFRRIVRSLCRARDGIAPAELCTA